MNEAITPFTFDGLEDLLGIEETRNFWKVYNYNGKPVPRVSDIIHACFGDNDAIIKWASSLGKKYHKTRSDILDTGSVVHELIEEYISTGTTIDINNIKIGYKKQIKTSFNNFLYWEKTMLDHDFAFYTIDIERTVVCPWYGGTLDWLVELNGKVYILDFKTSRAILPDYYIQTILYKEAINNYDNIHVDGIGIIRLDKFKYDTLDFIIINDIDDFEFMNHIRNDAISMIDWFYHQTSLKYESKEFKLKYKGVFNYE